MGNSYMLPPSSGATTQKQLLCSSLARSHAGNCILTGRRFPALRHYCVATDAALVASTISAATADVATAAASTAAAAAAAATREARLMSITDYHNTHLTQYSTITLLQ